MELKEFECRFCAYHRMEKVSEMDFEEVNCPYCYERMFDLSEESDEQVYNNCCCHVGCL